MDQGELVEGLSQILHFSAQVALEADSNSELGVKVLHPNELRGQMLAALSNIDAVLDKSGMTRNNILTLRFLTTDIDGFLENYDVYVKWIKDTGIMPPQALIGVQRLVLPELIIEIEATAGE